MAPTQQDDSAAIAETTRSAIAGLAGREGPLLPILHRVQAEFGYVPQSALPVIAEALNLSRAEVHGVVSFYHDFRSAPAGAHVLRVCQAEACRAMGAERLARIIVDRLGADLHETSPDGSVTVEPVYCLGLCACAPAAMLDGRPIGRLDAAAIDEIVTEVRA